MIYMVHIAPSGAELFWVPFYKHTASLRQWIKPESAYQSYGFIISLCHSSEGATELSLR